MSAVIMGVAGAGTIVVSVLRAFERCSTAGGASSSSELSAAVSAVAGWTRLPSPAVAAALSWVAHAGGPLGASFRPSFALHLLNALLSSLLSSLVLGKGSAVPSALGALALFALHPAATAEAVCVPDYVNTLAATTACLLGMILAVGAARAAGAAAQKRRGTWRGGAASALLLVCAVAVVLGAAACTGGDGGYRAVSASALLRSLPVRLARAMRLLAGGLVRAQNPSTSHSHLSLSPARAALVPPHSACSAGADVESALSTLVVSFFSGPRGGVDYGLGQGQGQGHGKIGVSRGGPEAELVLALALLCILVATVPLQLVEENEQQECASAFEGAPSEEFGAETSVASAAGAAAAASSVTSSLSEAAAQAPSDAGGGSKGLPVWTIRPGGASPSVAQAPAPTLAAAAAARGGGGGGGRKRAGSTSASARASSAAGSEDDAGAAGAQKPPTAGTNVAGGSVRLAAAAPSPPLAGGSGGSGWAALLTPLAAFRLGALLFFATAAVALSLPSSTFPYSSPMFADSALYLPLACGGSLSAAAILHGALQAWLALGRRTTRGGGDAPATAGAAAGPAIPTFGQAAGRLAFLAVVLVGALAFVSSQFYATRQYLASAFTSEIGLWRHASLAAQGGAEAGTLLRLGQTQAGLELVDEAVASLRSSAVSASSTLGGPTLGVRREALAWCLGIDDDEDEDGAHHHHHSRHAAAARGGDRHLASRAFARSSVASSQPPSYFSPELFFPYPRVSLAALAQGRYATVLALHARRRRDAAGGSGGGGGGGGGGDGVVASADDRALLAAALEGVEKAYAFAVHAIPWRVPRTAHMSPSGAAAASVEMDLRDFSCSVAGTPASLRPVAAAALAADPYALASHAIAALRAGEVLLSSADAEDEVVAGDGGVGAASSQGQRRAAGLDLLLRSASLLALGAAGSREAALSSASGGLASLLGAQHTCADSAGLLCGLAAAAPSAARPDSGQGLLVEPSTIGEAALLAGDSFAALGMVTLAARMHEIALHDASVQLSGRAAPWSSSSSSYSSSSSSSSFLRSVSSALLRAGVRGADAAVHVPAPSNDALAAAVHGLSLGVAAGSVELNRTSRAISAEGMDAGPSAAFRLARGAARGRHAFSGDVLHLGGAGANATLQRAPSGQVDVCVRVHVGAGGRGPARRGAPAVVPTRAAARSQLLALLLGEGSSSGDEKEAAAAADSLWEGAPTCSTPNDWMTPCGRLLVAANRAAEAAVSAARRRRGRGGGGGGGGGGDSSPFPAGLHCSCTSSGALLASTREVQGASVPQQHTVRLCVSPFAAGRGAGGAGEQEADPVLAAAASLLKGLAAAADAGSAQAAAPPSLLVPELLHHAGCGSVDGTLATALPAPLAGWMQCPLGGTRAGTCAARMRSLRGQSLWYEDALAAVGDGDGDGEGLGLQAGGGAGDRDGDGDGAGEEGACGGREGAAAARAARVLGTRPGVAGPEGVSPARALVAAARAYALTLLSVRNSLAEGGGAAPASASGGVPLRLLRQAVQAAAAPLLVLVDQCGC